MVSIADAKFSTATVRAASAGAGGLRIALDLLGADRPAVELISELAQLDPQHYQFVLVGPAGLSAKIPGLVAETAETDSFIAQSDALQTALRRRPRASMRLALELLRDHRVDGVVSAGNTAALMALARQVLPRAPGLKRPAICKMLEGKSVRGVRKPVWLLDLGANIECSAQQLFQFAVMGAQLAATSPSTRTPVSRPPVVGLLNIGAEITKGPAVLAEAAQLFTNCAEFDYCGFVEAHELFDGRADVVVSDGLLGNVALKAMEGTAAMAQHLLREHLAKQRSKAGLRGWLVERLLATRALVNVYDPQGYNGATLLGLGGVVVKSHGAADGSGYLAAVKQARQEIVAGIPQRVFDLFGE